MWKVVEWQNVVENYFKTLNDPALCAFNNKLSAEIFTVDLLSVCVLMLIFNINSTILYPCWLCDCIPLGNGTKYWANIWQTQVNQTQLIKIFHRLTVKWVHTLLVYNDLLSNRTYQNGYRKRTVPKSYTLSSTGTKFRIWPRQLLEYNELISCISPIEIGYGAALSTMGGMGRSPGGTKLV